MPTALFSAVTNASVVMHIKSSGPNPIRTHPAGPAYDEVSNGREKYTLAEPGIGGLDSRRKERDREKKKKLKRFGPYFVKLLL